MGGIIGIGGGGSSPNVTRLAGVQVSTSLYSQPIPVAFGMCRLPINLLDYDGFYSTENETDTGGGKGGGSSTVSSYNYFADIIGALCQGQTSSISRIWRDDDIVSANDVGFVLFDGAEGQSPWSVWASKYPDKALSYSGLTYVGAVSFALGTSGNMPNITVEVAGLHSGDTEDGNAWPNNVITTILTDVNFGMGLPSDMIADFSASASGYATYCKAMGFAISPAYTDSGPLSDAFQGISDATNSDVIWRSAGRSMVFDMLPLGYIEATGNGVTYEPNRRPVVDIFFEDLLGVVDKDGASTGDFGLEIERTKDTDVINCQPVEYLDAGNQFNSATVQEVDAGDASENGDKVSSSLTLKMIRTAEHASIISKLKVSRSVNNRNTYNFSLPFNFIFLEPGDLITFTSEMHGMDAWPILIRKMSEGAAPSASDDVAELGGLDVEAEDWLGIPGATIYARDGSASPGDSSTQPIAPAPSTTGSTGGGSPGRNVAPGASEAPAMFEAPPAMTSGARQLWLATTGGVHWGGAYVHVSIDDGASYQQVGKVTRRARYGLSTAPIGTGTGETLAVALTGYQASALSGTSAQGLASGATLSLIGAEVIAYQNSALTSASNYALTTLRRGLKGTSAASHATGAQFVRLDSAIFKHDISDGISDGDTIRIKLQSFNIFGAGLQKLSDCTEYYYTLAGHSWPAAGSVTLALSSTKPSTAAAHAHISDDWSDGVLWDGGAARYIMSMWCSVAWGWDGDNPAGGFEVLLHAGDNPADESTHVRVVQVEPACRLAVLAINPSEAVTLRASVRSINV